MSLEKGGFLSIKTSNKFSVVTIDNWALYQGSDNDDEQQNEQQVSNKRATNEQQMSTNKNVKNKENEKNDEKDSCCSDDIESIFGLNEKQDPVPDTSDTDSEPMISVHEYRQKVAYKYLSRRGKGFYLTKIDEDEVDSYIVERIPLRVVLQGIDYSFDNFKPKHNRDEIKSLKYCSPVIFSLYAQQGTVPAAEASGAVPEVDAVPPGEKGKENVIDLLEQLKKMRGDTG
ncbi:hypothetical protein PMJ10TS2_60280 [Paenibacillus melissococcoides]